MIRLLLKIQAVKLWQILLHYVPFGERVPSEVGSEVVRTPMRCEVNDEIIGREETYILKLSHDIRCMHTVSAWDRSVQRAGTRHQATRFLRPRISLAHGILLAAGPNFQHN